ncbi:DinB family protein [Cytobacillus suaedae]|nr:DinB family protein [Cytobacillus suaedae]
MKLDFRVRPIEGFTPKIGELMSMLEYTRALTLEDIKDLSQVELDQLVDEESNSVGALLLHIASIEAVHQVVAFENRDFNESELLKWETPLWLGQKAQTEIKNQPLEYYIDELTKVREKTLALFKTVDDGWLSVEKKWDNGVPHNNYWLWYHVMEDEISHRGQIRILKRMIFTK